MPPALFFEIQSKLSAFQFLQSVCRMLSERQQTINGLAMAIKKALPPRSPAPGKKKIKGQVLVGSFSGSPGR